MTISAWDLNLQQRKAIGRLYKQPKPLAHLPHVGLNTLHQLIGFGLVQVDRSRTSARADYYYRLTEDGEKMHLELAGLNRIPPPPLGVAFKSSAVDSIQYTVDKGGAKSERTAATDSGHSKSP